MTSSSEAITTGLGKAELHRILVRGRDLTQELVGHITFADMTYLELTGKLPTEEQRRMIDALLIILVEHGMVSAAVNARLIYHTAPEAIQAAVAAAILGAGSVHLGSSEYSAKMLTDAVPPGMRQLDLDFAANSIVEQYAARKERIAGIGHRTHAEGDPRADRLFEIARETGVYGTYCELIQRVAQAAGKRHGRDFPVNVTGAIGAIALDMGLPWQITKAFALIGRTLGAMAHIAEEVRNPVATKIDAAIKSRLEYVAEEA